MVVIFVTTVTEAENGWKKYNYLVAAKGKDIPEMSFEMSDDFCEIFIDSVTLEYDSVVSSRDTTGYLVTGQGLLEGGFEDIITDQNGNAPEDFGWTYAHNEGIARVVRTDGGRALYVKNISCSLANCSNIKLSLSLYVSREMFMFSSYQ